MPSIARVTFVAMLLPVILVGQQQQIDRRFHVGVDRPVDIGARTTATVEPYLAIDPYDPKHMVASVSLANQMGDPRQSDGGGGTITCAALASFDAGETWQRHDFPERSCLDSWVAILRDDHVVFLAQEGSELITFRSTDGGRTWTERSTSFGRGFDHGTMVVDRRDNALYVVASHSVRQAGGSSRSSVFIARSDDGGATFDTKSDVTPSSLPTFPLSPVVTSTGTLVVPFRNLARSISSMPQPPLDLTWSIASADRSRTFSAPSFVADCGSRWSSVAADASTGPYKDRIYLTCWDRPMERLYLFTSNDAGSSWSPPTLVSRGYVQNGMVAVSNEGIVGVAWYDGRDDPRGYRAVFRCQHVYFTASLDGGSTFLPEVKVSSAENCPDTPQNAEAGRRWVAGGDYFGLAAASDGSFRLLWADSRGGIYQLRSSTVRVVDQSLLGPRRGFLSRPPRPGEARPDEAGESPPDHGRAIARHACFLSDGGQCQLGWAESAHQAQCRVEDLFVRSLFRSWAHRVSNRT